MIVLCGFHKSGKSRVGRLIAERLGFQFFDVDRVLEVQNGFGTVRELHTSVGEERFRELESEAIRMLPCDDREMVVATGGGSLLREENVVELSRRGKLCFLDAAWEVLKRRWAALPSFVSTWEEAEEIYLQRRALYQRSASWHVEVANEGVERIAATILNQYGE